MLSDIVVALVVLFQRQNSAPIYQIILFGKLLEGYAAYLMAICHASETQSISNFPHFILETIEISCLYLN